MADRAYGILLDTSAIIAHLRRRIDIFSLTSRNEPLFLPLVVLGELYKGVEKSNRPGHNRRLVDEFLEMAGVLYPEITTAVSYGKIAVALERTGKTMPENDVWIAAVALECDMPLATLNAHFDRVKGLTVIHW